MQPLAGAQRGRAGWCATTTATPAYDARVVADLARLHERAEPVVDDLAGALDRYRTYGPACATPSTEVEAGDGDWFTKPMMPSFHTVWFELHEDLLATLGLDRSAEGRRGGPTP